MHLWAPNLHFSSQKNNIFDEKSIFFHWAVLAWSWGDLGVALGWFQGLYQGLRQGLHQGLSLPSCSDGPSQADRP